MHEIITLQLGQRANYLATHFWNVQESYFTYSEHEEPLINHDVHFRAGVGADGTDTYTPRTVIYDLKGGFGSLRKINSLYEHESGSAPIRGLWDGITSTQRQEPIQPTQYQNNLDHGLPTFQLYDRDVRYWSDFNRVFYHPRSIVQLSEYELNSQLMPFENWSAGEELYQSLDKDFDLLDRDFRPFAEECDQLQGIQLLGGIDDAWGGFASQYVDSLRDEYGKASMWMWGIEDGHRTTFHQRRTRSLNAARSMCHLGQQASIYARLSTHPTSLPPAVHLHSSSDWYSSALLCSALETVTLPTRLLPAGGRTGSLTTFEDLITAGGQRRVVDVSVEFPTASNDMNQQQLNGDARIRAFEPSHSQHHQQQNSAVERLDIDLTNNNATADQSATKGYPFAQIKVQRSHRLTTANAWESDNTEDQRIRMLAYETVVEVFQARKPFPVLDTFPNDLISAPANDAADLAISAALTSTSRTKGEILRLRDVTRRSAPLAEREALYTDLTTIAENYAHGWDEGSDTGEDD